MSNKIKSESNMNMNNNKIKKVMAFGAFDVLHDGHIFFLKEAKKYGELTVVVARDSNILKFKGQESMNNENTRKKDVEKLGIADIVLIGDKREFLKTILDNFPDIICVGYDQKFPVDNFEEKLSQINSNVKIIRVKPYRENEFKSSIIKKQM